MIILEEQTTNDIQQSTLIVLEGSGLYIELDLMVIGTMELILVGYRIICTKQQFRVLLQNYGCILNTQQQTLKRSTIYNVWSAYIDPRGTILCMGRGRTYIFVILYIHTNKVST